jgi:hypothetical protein
VSNDVLRVVLSFVRHQRRHCIVCEQWCDAVHLKRVHLGRDDVSGDTLIHLLQRKPIHLSLFCPPHHNFGGTVSMATSLAHVRVIISDATDKLAREVANLCMLRGLTVFHLRLDDCTMVTEAGICSIAKLSQCRQLTSISLIIVDLFVGDYGCRHLSALTALKKLTSLTLRLPRCGLGDDSAGMASTFSVLPLLTDVFIQLQYNHLSDIALSHLCRFKQCKSLRKLTLDLSCNGHLTDSGIIRLYELCHTSSLTDVDIVLPNAVSLTVKKVLKDYLRTGMPLADIRVF